MIPGLILVVDDQKRQRETLVQVLEQWGHEVRQAEDGQTVVIVKLPLFQQKDTELTK